MTAPGARIGFANALRGLAALSVLISHFFYNFFMLPGVVADLIGAPALPLRPNPLTAAIDATLPAGFFGHFGVALFFLISGFVIPFAFQDRSRAAFAVGRLLRLWPTYAIGLTFSALAIWACARWYGQKLPFAASTYLLQLGFVEDLSWRPAVDAIFWTLGIEVKFYLLAMLLAPALRAGRLSTVLAAALLIAGAALAATRLPGWGVADNAVFHALYGLSLAAQMLVYMLIGTVLNLHHRGLVSFRIALAAGALLFALCGAQWAEGVLLGSFGAGLTSYAVALAVFGLAYLARNRAGSAPRPVLWVADISYPLYVIHAPAGYALLRVLTGAGVAAPLALLAACLFAFAAATLLHVAVERPSHRAGRALGRRIDG